MKKSLLLVTVSLAVPFLFSCAEKEEIIPLESISLDKTQVTLTVGEETVLKATPNPKNATTGFVWESSNHNSVTVTGGRLHAYSVPKDGQDVVITVQDKEKTKSATCSVHVLPKAPNAGVEADGITLSAQKVDMILGEGNVELLATVTPLNAMNRDVTWTIGDENVVRKFEEITQPNPSGSTLTEQKSSKLVIQAVDAGYTTIVASHGDFSLSVPVNVQKPADVIELISFDFSESELSVEVGDSVSNLLTYNPSNATDKLVNYSSSNTDVATVNAVNGYVTGVSVGDATITATLVSDPTKTASYDVHVTPLVQELRVYRGSSYLTYPLALKSENSTEYVIYNHKFESNDEFILHINKKDYGLSVLKNYDAANFFEGCGRANYLKSKNGVLCDIYVDISTELDESAERIYVDTHFMMKSNADVTSWDYVSIPLKEEENNTTEYLAANIVLEKGSQFLFNIKGTYYKYEDLKISSPAHSYLASASGDFKVKVTGTYTIYVQTGSIDRGVYIDATPNSIDDVVYTFELNDSNNWIINDNAKVYAWAFYRINDGENHDYFGHWYLGSNVGSTLTFTIPVNLNIADFVRISGEISDLSKWDGTTFSGLGTWNRADAVYLSGETSTISFDFGSWHD